jgi:hypothetical protein
MFPTVNTSAQRNCGNELADARQLISKSRSFRELQKALNNSGHEIEDIEDVISFAKYAWWESNGLDPVPETTRIPRTPWLPSIEVFVDDTQYYIHGLVHETTTSKVTVSPSVKNYVGAAAKLFHRPENGIDYVYESGLDSTFPFLASHSTDDFIGFFSVYLQIENEPLNNQNENMVESCVNLEQIKRGLSYEPAEAKLKSALRHGVSQLEDIIFIRDICKNYFLPPPLSIEEKIYRARLLSQVDNPDANYKRSRLINTLGRSKYMTQYMHAYAKQNALESLHAFVGLAHESQIAFFLTEPDYVI